MHFPTEKRKAWSPRHSDTLGDGTIPPQGQGSGRNISGTVRHHVCINQHFVPGRPAHSQRAAQKDMRKQRRRERLQRRVERHGGGAHAVHGPRAQRVVQGRGDEPLPRQTSISFHSQQSIILRPTVPLLCALPGRH